MAFLYENIKTINKIRRGVAFTYESFNIEMFNKIHGPWHQPIHKTHPHEFLLFLKKYGKLDKNL